MGDTEYTIRRVGQADMDEWLRLRKMLWDQTSADEHREEMIDIFEHTDSQLVLVAQNGNGGLVGFMEASIRPFVEDCNTDQVGYLEGWFVELEHRKHGIGRKLVEGAENWARERGCEEMASDAEVGNELSYNAHTKLGYKETSRLVHLRKDLN